MDVVCQVMVPTRLELGAFYGQGAFHTINSYMGYMMHIRKQLISKSSFRLYMRPFYNMTGRVCELNEEHLILKMS